MMSMGSLIYFPLSYTYVSNTILDLLVMTTSQFLPILC